MGDQAAEAVTADRYQTVTFSCYCRYRCSVALSIGRRRQTEMTIAELIEMLQKALNNYEGEHKRYAKIEVLAKNGMVKKIEGVSFSIITGGHVINVR